MTALRRVLNTAPRLSGSLCVTILSHWTDRIDLFNVSLPLRLFSYRSNTAEDKFVFCNGLVLHRLQCLRGFGEWLDSIKDFSLSLKSLNLEIQALACLSALSMITGKHRPAVTRSDCAPFLSLPGLRWTVALAVTHTRRSGNRLPLFRNLLCLTSSNKRQISATCCHEPRGKRTPVGFPLSASPVYGN